MPRSAAESATDPKLLLLKPEVRAIRLTGWQAFWSMAWIGLRRTALLRGKCMTVSFIGLIGYNGRTEIHETGDGPPLDLTFMGAAAKAHEDAGFDRVLIAFESSSPDSIVVTAY